METMITGKHLIAGQWVSAERTFRTDPYRGIGREYAEGTSKDIDNAVTEADRAFDSFARSSSRVRCDLLNAIAVRMEQNRSEIIELCCDETGFINCYTDALCNQLCCSRVS